MKNKITRNRNFKRALIKSFTLIGLPALIIASASSSMANWNKVVSCYWPQSSNEILVIDQSTDNPRSYQMVIRDQNLVKEIVNTVVGNPCAENVLRPNSHGEIIKTVESGGGYVSFSGIMCGRGQGLYVTARDSAQSGTFFINFSQLKTLQVYCYRY